MYPLAESVDQDLLPQRGLEQCISGCIHLLTSLMQWELGAAREKGLSEREHSRTSLQQMLI